MEDEVVKLCGAQRSGRWPTFRDNYLKDKTCAVCGGKEKLELHHIKPFHKYPELELSKANVLPLCEAENNGLNCHQLIGHLGSYLSINKNVKRDATTWRNKILNRLQ